MSVFLIIKGIAKKIKPITLRINFLCGELLLLPLHPIIL